MTTELDTRYYVRVGNRYLSDWDGERTTRTSEMSTCWMDESGDIDRLHEVAARVGGQVERVRTYEKRDIIPAPVGAHT